MRKNYTMNTGIVAVLLALTILFPFNGLAQSKNALVGTWKLVSATETTKTGEVRDVSGRKNPTGLLTYTADGRVMVIMTSGGRKPLSVGATAEEKAELLFTIAAYGGRYTLDGNKVIHHIEVASAPIAENTDQERLITNLTGDSLTFRTATLVAPSEQIAFREFVWERISSN
jgi:hypothetical protein